MTIAIKVLLIASSLFNLITSIAIFQLSKDEEASKDVIIIRAFSLVYFAMAAGLAWMAAQKILI